MIGALHLAELQFEACYVHGDGGRLLEIRDIGGGRAPLVAVTRTAAGAVLRLGAHAPAGLEEAAVAFAAALGPLPTDEAGDSGAAAAMRELVSGFAPVERTWAGPAFVVPAAAFAVPGAMELYPANAVLLHPELATWGPELRSRKPCFGVFRGGQAVAICASSRTTARAAEAGVETVAAFRGQGAAGLVVAAWAEAVRASGRVPFYSTSWENTASRAVASKLELEFFGENIRVT